MKLSDKQINRMITLIFRKLKDQNVVTFKDKEESVFQKAVAIIKADLQRERDLDDAVNKMMDDLEEQNPGSFQRYKMFPMLKKRLAEEKGIIL